MTPNTGLKDDYYERSKVSSSGLNRLAQLVDTQPYGSLAAIGEGIIQNAAGTSLAVTPGSGLSVSVAAGAAIIMSAASTGFAVHPIFGKLAAGEIVDCSDQEASTPFYIHAGLKTASISSDPDTELGTGGLRIFASGSLTVPGALRLATCTHDNSSVAVTPSNLYTRLDKVILDLSSLADDLSQIAGDIGYDDDERVKGSVAQRLTVLETAPVDGGEGGGGSSLIYLEQLKDRAADPRNAIVVRDELLAALREELLAAIESGGRVPTSSESGLIARNQALLIHQSAEVHPHNVLDFQGAFVSKGLYGDGSADTENHILINTMVEDDRGWRPA